MRNLKIKSCAPTTRREMDSRERECVCVRCLFSHQHLPDRPQVLEILRREVSVCIIIGLTARRGGERKGKEEVESEYVCVEQRRRRRGGIWRGADGDWRNEGIQEREVETLAHV